MFDHLFSRGGTRIGSPAYGQVNQQRLCQTVGVCPHVQTQGLRKIRRVVLPGLEWNAGFVLCGRSKNQTERARAICAAVPTLPKVSRTNRRRLCFCRIADPEQLKIRVGEEEPS